MRLQNIHTYIYISLLRKEEEAKMRYFVDKLLTKEWYCVKGKDKGRKSDFPHDLLHI